MRMYDSFQYRKNTFNYFFSMPKILIISEFYYAGG